MAAPRYVSKALTVAADDDGICASQTPLAAGAITINGALATAGVANLASQRQVLFTFAADESSHTFVVTGTDDQDVSIHETVTGTNTTAVTLLAYKTITSITISAAATGAIKVGTNGVGWTPWQIINWDAGQINLGMAVLVSGTVNYTWQYTFEDPSGTYPNGTAIPTPFDLPALASKSANTDSSLLTPIVAWRLKINSGAGTANCCLIQSGLI